MMFARIASSLLLVALALAFTQWVVRLDAPPRRAAALLSDQGEPLTFPTHIQPVLSRYCYSCHGEKPRGGLDLRRYQDRDAMRRDRLVFERVLRNVQGGLMPPENRPQPTPAERATLVNWLNSELFFCDCSRPDPGRVTLRRLNRAEYNRTVQDLVGVDLRPADDFPADDTGYGFDNIGDVLSLPPVLFERYLAAAERILDAAVVTGPPTPAVRRFKNSELAGGAPDGSEGRSLSSTGEISFDHVFPQAGEYALRVTAYGDQAGPEPVRMAIRLAGQEVRTLEVPAQAEAPALYECRLATVAGQRRLAVAFLNDYYRPDDPDPRNRDRNLHVLQVELVGPIVTNLPALPESHRRIFFTQPKSGSREAELDAARRIVQPFAFRAFRRPVAASEVERLLEFYRAGEADGAGFAARVRSVLQAVLVSPHFLFRVEPPSATGGQSGNAPVDEYALASRLSYFLWSTMPDDDLFALAAQGRLRRNLEAQVRRMLQHPKAQALVENFAGQWLQLRKLDEVAPDPSVFPGFDDALRTAMRRETEACFGRILREDRSVLDFLDADWTYANERLARHYGLAGVRGDHLQLVSVKGTARGGLLSQASILTLTSNPTRTSPVKRGKWVLDNLLGSPPPPPPPNVPLLDETKQARLTGTLRQRMEQHRADPLCASCHALMDPIGFGFENYDGIGAWRAKDGEFPIDPAGALTSGESFQGAADLKRILLESKREEFVRCLASKVLTYALGRGLEYYDQCAVEEIGRALKKHDYRFSALILAVVESVPFQMRRAHSTQVPAQRNPTP